MEAVAEPAVLEQLRHMFGCEPLFRSTSLFFNPPPLYVINTNASRAIDCFCEDVHARAPVRLCQMPAHPLIRRIGEDMTRPMLGAAWLAPVM